MSNFDQRNLDRPAAERETLIFSLRMIKYFALFMMSWQGSMVGGSVMEVSDLFLFNPIAADEFYLIMLFGVLLMERSVLQDYRVRSTYFTAPSLVLLLALFISWCRGVYLNQRFAIVYEAHEAILIPIALLIIANCFRDQTDRWNILRILLLAPLFKAIEGVDIYLFSTDPKKSWGVVEMWRDGYLLGLGMVSSMLFLHFRPKPIPILRRVVLLCIPILCFTLIMSLRRTFIVGTIVSALTLVVTLGKGRRGKQLAIVFGMLAILGVVILSTDPLGVLGRLSGIIDPKEEGSAYIRLLEYPNVLANIAHNPIFGTAIGTQWKQYYRMPISAVYTTLGTHNTYLYFPLRTGLLGTIGFLWLLGRIWKSVLINWRLADSDENKYFAQLLIQMFLVYQVACFFGLMYGDAMSSLFGALLVFLQLQSEFVSGQVSYARISLIDTLRSGKLTLKQPRKRLQWSPGRTDAVAA